MPYLDRRAARFLHMYTQILLLHTYIPGIVRLSQISEDAENDRLFGTEGAGGREIPDVAQPVFRVSHTVEVRARRLQVLENGRVQHAAGELV